MNRVRRNALAAAALLVAAIPGALQGQTERGWLGISYFPALAHGPGGRPAQTLVVADVHPDSPARAAGIARGDTIVSVNGRAIDDATLLLLARSISPGEKVRLGVRDGRRRDVVVAARPRPAAPVVLGPQGQIIVVTPERLRSAARVYLDSARLRLVEAGGPVLRIARVEGDSVFAFHLGPEGWPARAAAVDTLRLTRPFGRVHRLAPAAAEYFRVAPDPAGTAARYRFEAAAAPRPHPVELGLRAVAGAELAELEAGLSDYFHADSGLLVLRVAPHTPADRAGLRPGDVVVAAGGGAVRSVDALRRAVAASGTDPVRLRVVRKSRTIELRLGAR